MSQVLMSDGPTFISLFAGVGGFDLGLERAGFRCVGQVEIDAAAQRVLALRFPGVERWRDVRGVARELEWQSDGSGPRASTEVRSELLLPVDLLVGGFPCQDLSVAGKRAGLGGERSGLFWEIVRIAKEIRPRWGLFENVPGLLSSAGGRDMGLVLAGLRECWPAVGYRVLDSRHFGVAQRRRRVFFVCGPDEASVAAVLFEPEGGAGDLAARGEAGEGIARCVATGTSGSRYDWETETFVTDTLNSGGNSGIAKSLRAQGNLAHREDVDTLGTHTLKAEGHDASEDGTGRGVPMVTLGMYANGGTHGEGDTNEMSPALKVDGLAAVAFREDQRTGDCFETPVPSGIANGGGKPGQGYPAIRAGMAVRRLTPTECERLQGFPDGWTCTDLSLEAWAEDPENAAELCRCPDSPRYRMMGNAVTVNVIEWLGRRLMNVLA